MNTQRAGVCVAVLCCLGMHGVVPVASASDAAATRAAILAPTSGTEVPLPAWLWGVWNREWIVVGPSKTSELDVHYLQTPTYFADIRIPKARAGFPAVKSFADLSEPQLRLLAGQNGLTGLTTLSGNIVNWSDEIAFQPSDGTPDTSHVERKGANLMHEVGLDGSFTESWRRVSEGSGQFLVVRVKRSARLLNSLVVVGDRFVYVRNRARDLPAASSFDALIEKTRPSREQLIEYLDCEFSTGLVRGGSVPWEIRQSTLPWREGHHLEFVDQLTVHDKSGVLAPGSIDANEWSIPVNTIDPRQLKMLFGATATSQ